MVQAPRNDPVAGPRGRGRPSAPDEPEPAALDTDPPSWLKHPAALIAWNRAIALLTESRMVASADLTTLGRYCQYLAEWCELTECIDLEGLLVDRERRVVNKKDQPSYTDRIANPAINARDTIERALRQVEKALGLDPAAYLAITKDMAAQARERAKIGGQSNRPRVGGFLNKKEKPP